MAWFRMWPLLVLAIIIVGGFALIIFIILTEGRYFGRQFLRWFYDLRTGEFEVRDDWDLWQVFIRRLNISPSELLLDLGTQTGHLPRMLARQRGFQGKAVGIDWAEELIKEAKRQSRLEGTASRTEFFCGDVDKPLPFPDNSFSMVVCVTGLLEGIREPETLFKEIQRVLQPGGRVVFSYSPRMLMPPNPRDVKWFRKMLLRFRFNEPQFLPWISTRKIIVSTLKEPADEPR